MLKKCIVVMVMFAMVAGASFAQVTFGGQLQQGMTLFSGDNVIGVGNPDTDSKYANVNMGGSYNASTLFHEAKFSALFGDGTAGGRLVYNVKGGNAWGWMQWRPNQYFRVKIGQDGDGEGGFAQIVGWGFTGEAKNSVSAVNDYDGGMYHKYRHAGLTYGAYDGDANFNVQFTYFPTDLISINFLFKKFDTLEEITAKLSKMQIYSSIKLEEIGTIRVAAEGGGGFARHEAEGGTGKDGDPFVTFHLAFYSGELVQGLAFEAGTKIDTKHRNVDTYDPITVGGGINLTSTDPFNFKLRTGVSFGGKTAGVDNDTTGFTVNILPSYKLPKLTIFLYSGFGMETKKDSDEDPVYSWFVNPYIWVPMGGMRMWVGLQVIDAHVVQEGRINWNIPFGFNFYF